MKGEGGLDLGMLRDALKATKNEDVDKVAEYIESMVLMQVEA